MEGAAINVKVAVRVRPMNNLELSERCKRIVSVVENTITLEDPALYSEKPKHPFAFDHAYDIDCTQEQLYQDLGIPLLEKALAGYNGTIFAYGQTGSGKTHSITGSPDHPGIVPRMNKDIFEHVARSVGHKTFMITVSYLELYNENIYDLLGASSTSHASGDSLKVREHPKLGVYVEGLAELVVSDHLDIERKMIEGNSMRHVASTKMNEHSSRSHSVFTLKISQKDASDMSDEGATTQAKINLVDLAGSERAAKTEAEGNTLKEAAMINTSLSALGNVINALADPKKRKGHVPFRSSKLTRLLQESLGGNTVTVMVAALSPADRNFDETLNTLQYANRAKNTQNRNGKNTTSPAQLVKELRQQLELLQQQMMNDRNGGENGNSVRERDMALLSTLESMKNQTAEDAKRMSSKLSEDRWLGLAKNGMLQFQIHYYRKMRAMNEATLTQLARETSALRAHMEQLQLEMAELDDDTARDRRKKEDLEQSNKQVKQQLSRHTRGLLLETWRASVRASKAMHDWSARHANEIQALKNDMQNAQTLEIRMELQGREIEILYEELAAQHAHTRELEARLGQKTRELEVLVGDITNMLNSESDRIAELEQTSAMMDEDLHVLSDQQEQNTQALSIESTVVEELQTQLQGLLAERAEQEAAHRLALQDMLRVYQRDREK